LFLLLLLLLLLFSGGREEGDNATGSTDGEEVVDVRREGLKEEEGGADEQEEEKGVVVENGEGGRFVVRDLVLLPQNSFVFFFLCHLFIIGQPSHHFFSYGVLTLYRYLMLQDMFGFTISEGDEPRADNRHHEKERP